jgi:endoglucanase
MNPTHIPATKRLLVIALPCLFALEGAPGWPAQPAGKPSPVISRCNKPFVFGFGTWENARTEFLSKPDGLHISAKTDQGGAGLLGGEALSLIGYENWTPALKLLVTEANKAPVLNVTIADAAERGAHFTFDLRNLKRNRVVQVLANYGASLAEPEKPGKRPDLARITNVLVMGGWTAEPVDVVLSEIVLVPPNDEVRAGRAKLREIRARDAEQARLQAEARAKARAKLLEEGSPHPADGPQVKQVCAVAVDVLAITLQAGFFVPNELRPYSPAPNDEIVEEKESYNEVRNGRVVAVHYRTLYQTVGGQRTRIGALSPDGKFLFKEHTTAGQLLDETIVDQPAAYRIQSANDPTYAAPVQPLAVFRKGKPNGPSRPLPFLYTISLKLPAPLKEGATYTIRLRGLNASQENVAYVHKPRTTRSLAVHAIQNGYRPDDPCKRAYLSFWMGVDKDGKNGSCTPNIDVFELVDPAGWTVFSGKAEVTKKVNELEQICVHEKLDYTLAAVRRLDFSSFSRPGEYRVCVPGIGTSGPLRIAADVWEKPFQLAMQSVLTQRQAIELGPPACTYRRPRPFHPDEGVEFYQLTIPVQAGQEGPRGDNLVELAKSGSLKRVAGVWGGYQDAGDWDTLGHHLSATYDLLGLYFLNPAAFTRMKLSLPAEEMKNNLPDLLDEALWQMQAWRRLQLPDGGVRGGYGYGWGCPNGITSSMIRSAGVYAVDHDTTMHYAAAAARTARVLAAFDRKLAAEYLESAKRAWSWVEAHSNKDDGIYQRVLSFDKNLPGTLRHKRAMAAVELLAATRDPVYDEAFKQSSELSAQAALYLDQADADFAYAGLPNDLGNPELKKRAVERIAAYADHALEFSRKNGFEIIAGTRTDFPLIAPCRWFSTPGQGGFVLIYAYELTKKPAYLAAAVQGANYSLGANPDNLSYCTGLGYNAQHFNFIVDALLTGQVPDILIGHIPYGQGNEGSSMCRPANSWVQQWYLNYGPTKKMVPNWYNWPVNEQYIDFAVYPLHNENCFNATAVPAACYWFYLHTRREAGK